jgi:signal peptidase
MSKEIPARNINVAFLLLVLLAMVMPALLTSYFGLSANTVVSGSMRPDIEPGDVIIAKQKVSADVRIGDVVIFLDRKTWEVQAHRVIAKKLENGIFTFTTQGDANSEPDSPFEIGASAPLRTSSAIIPNVGYTLSAMQRSDVRIYTGIALLAIMVFLIFGLQGRRKEGEPTTEDSSHILSSELDERYVTIKPTLQGEDNAESVTPKS